MKKTLAVFVAMLGLVASAAVQRHNWFDLEIDSIGSVRTWPADGSDYEAYRCTVTNTAAAAFADGRLVVSADESPMSVCPSKAASVGTNAFATVSAAMRVVPFAADEVPEVPANAKTAVIAVMDGAETNYWVVTGAESPVWTNTHITADTEAPVEVTVTVQQGEDGTTDTSWSFGSNVFSCVVSPAAELHGVRFQGDCELASCWGRSLSENDFVTFYITGVPADVVVSAFDESGEEIARSDSGDYRSVGESQVKLVFSPPEDWVFTDGLRKWSYEVDSLVAGACLPFPVRDDGPGGLHETDYGPENGWMVVTSEDEVEHYATLKDALAGLKASTALQKCYSTVRVRDMYVTDGGRMFVVNGVEFPVRERYHLVDRGALVALINDGEADITSIAEDSEDPTMMLVGSVPESYPGFGYSVLFADEPAFGTDADATAPVPGTGGKLELKAPKGENGRRFYRISITDRMPEE